jgi:polysaccharide pyruvyl transferase WcaK-like protein
LAYESEADLLAKANFKAVFLRNTTDIETMRRKLNCPVEAMPDLAFLLKPTGNDVLSQYRKKDRKTIGVFVTDYVNPAIDRSVKEFGSRSWSFIQVMAKQLDKISITHEVILVPCSTGGYGDDRRINLDLAAFMEKRPTNIMDSLSPQSMIDLISGLDATVCMRFHAHIFSIIAGKPFVSIGFTRKVQLLLEENGIHGVELGKFDKDEFKSGEMCEIIEAVSDKTDTARYLAAANANHSRLMDLIGKVRQEWLQ